VPAGRALHNPVALHAQARGFQFYQNARERREHDICRYQGAEPEEDFRRRQQMRTERALNDLQDRREHGPASS
jgi:hypothetical protein